MKVIWKYQIFAEDITTLQMPKGAQVLTVQTQHGEPQLWVLVDPKEPDLEFRRFRLIGTGHLFELDDLKYIGTFQTHDGHFIGHLFEEGGA